MISSILALGCRKPTKSGDSGGILEYAFKGRHAVSPDGKLLAIGQPAYKQKADLEIWSLETGKQVTALSGHKADILDVAFSADGKTLASGSSDGLRFWDMAGRKEAAAPIDIGDPIVALCYSRDGQWLAIRLGNSDLIKWDVSRSKEVARVTTYGRFRPLFSHDGAFVIDGADAPAWNERYPDPPPHFQYLSLIDVSEWSVVSKLPVPVTKQYEDIEEFALSSHDNALVAITPEHRLHLFHGDKFETYKEAKLAFQPGGCAFSADGRHALTTQRNSLHFFDWKSGAFEKQVPLPTGASRFEITQDGRALVTFDVFGDKPVVYTLTDKREGI